MDIKNKLVPAHTEIRHLLEVDSYGAHAHRTESEEFKHVKHQMHQEKCQCYINNGRCEGQIEIHHSVIEYAGSSEVDWDKIHQDHPDFKDVDSRFQMMALCEKHHRKPGFGVHYLTQNIWLLQKYMKPDALDTWEKATIDALKK